MQYRSSFCSMAITPHSCYTEHIQGLIKSPRRTSMFEVAWESYRSYNHQLFKLPWPLSCHGSDTLLLVSASLKCWRAIRFLHNFFILFANAGKLWKHARCILPVSLRLILNHQSSCAKSLQSDVNHRKLKSALISKMLKWVEVGTLVWGLLGQCKIIWSCCFFGCFHPYPGSRGSSQNSQMVWIPTPLKSTSRCPWASHWTSDRTQQRRWERGRWCQSWSGRRVLERYRRKEHTWLDQGRHDLNVTPVVLSWP